MSLPHHPQGIEHLSLLLIIATHHLDFRRLGRTQLLYNLLITFFFLNLFEHLELLSESFEYTYAREYPF